MRTSEGHLLPALGRAFHRPLQSALAAPPTAVFLVTCPACSEAPPPCLLPLTSAPATTQQLPPEHRDPSSFLSPEWAGRWARQGSPALILDGRFPEAGPAGGGSGTTPRPPSLRARDMPVLPRVSSRLTDTHQTTAVSRSLCYLPMCNPR